MALITFSCAQSCWQIPFYLAAVAVDDDNNNNIAPSDLRCDHQYAMQPFVLCLYLASVAGFEPMASIYCHAATHSDAINKWNVCIQ